MGDIFGIGIEELIFVGVLIALLFGPESIPRIARNAGRLLNRLFRSPLYKEGQQIRRQIRDMPAMLARLAELEDLQKSLNSEISELKEAMNVDADGKLSQSIASVKQAAQNRIDSPAPGQPGPATPPAVPTQPISAPPSHVAE
ncbi:MAG TPA: twin-arginine translocase TatA/TatE family subunit [Anaerolineae bacterium]|nr:twin-arginine translocase TatA/TatE family subunit [Anaerolineae bacterium]